MQVQHRASLWKGVRHRISLILLGLIRCLTPALWLYGGATWPGGGLLPHKPRQAEQPQQNRPSLAVSRNQGIYAHLPRRQTNLSYWACALELTPNEPKQR